MPPRRNQPSLGPVVIAVTAGAFVLLSGLLVNGCRISKLLSSSNSPGAPGVIVVVPSLVRDSAIAGTAAKRVTNLSVTNGGSWSASSDDSWIEFAPTSGGSHATLRLSLDPRHLAPGMHRGSVTVQERDDDESATVSVNFLIQQPILEVKPDEFEFKARTNNSVFRDTLYITNEGNGPLVWTATTERRSGWLRFESDTTGTGPSALAIRVSNQGLGFFGTYRETIVISSPGAKHSPFEIEVKLSRDRGDDDDDDSPVPR